MRIGLGVSLALVLLGACARHASGLALHQEPAHFVAVSGAALPVPAQSARTTRVLSRHFSGADHERTHDP